jgi:tetratricopeptide (TPR) repeat protein
VAANADTGDPIRRPVPTREETVPQAAPPGERLRQLCLGILQFLHPDEPENPSLLPQAGSLLRAEAERQLAPMLEASLRSVTGKMRQELMTWLRTVDDLEQFGGDEAAASVPSSVELIWARRLPTINVLTADKRPATTATVAGPATDVLPHNLTAKLMPLDAEPLAENPVQRTSTGARPSRSDPASAAETATFRQAPTEAGPKGAPKNPPAPRTVSHDDSTQSEVDDLPSDNPAPLDRTARYLRAAKQVAQRGEHARAIEFCDKAIELKPDVPAGYFVRGRIHRLNGDRGAALEDLTTAIQLRTDDPEVFLVRGNVCMELGEFARANRDYTAALRLRPDWSDAFENRAMVHAKQNAWPETIADASAALQRNPQAAGALFLRGAAYFRLNQEKKALDDLTELLRLEPDHVLALNERGMVNASMERYREALADYAAALRLKPRLMIARYNRAVVLSLMGQTEFALTAFSELINAGPPNAAVFYQRGRLHLAQKNVEAAVADFESALAIEPEHPEVVQALHEVRQLSEPGREPPSQPKTPRAAPATDETDGAADGRIELTCAGCGTSCQARLDRLNRRFQCRKCLRVYHVSPSGNLDEIVPPRPKKNDLLQCHLRENWRWLTVAVLLVAVFLGGRYLWYHKLARSGPPALPTELEARAQLMGKAWLQDDTETMQRLTSGPQGRTLKYWLKDHPSPLGPQEREASRKGPQATIDLRIVDEKRDAVQVALAITHPFTNGPVSMQQEWVREGDTWFFKPFPEKKTAAGPAANKSGRQ